MKLKRIFASITMAALLIAMPAALSAQTDPNKGRIEGTWDVVLTADGEDFQQQERYTFIAGRTASDGSLVFSNEVDAVPPCGTDQGVWAKTSSRQFRLTHGAFCFQTEQTPSYTLKWREVVTLNTAEDQLTGRGVLEIRDTQGELLFSATYSLRGARMQAEPAAGLSNAGEADSSADMSGPGNRPSLRQWLRKL